MTCTELAGRSCSHPACHIFASRTDKENRSHTRPGLGQQCSRARPLPSFSEPPEMGAGLRGGGWIRVATGDHGSGPFSHPLVVSLILPSHFAWDSHSMCVLLNCPWFVICAQASQITQFVKNLLAVQETQFDSWVGKILWRRDRLPTPEFLGFPGGSAGKESACNAEDLGSIHGLGRSPGEGIGYPLQCSGLENSMNCIVPEVAKSQTRLSNYHFHFLYKLCYTDWGGSVVLWAIRQRNILSAQRKLVCEQLLAPPRKKTIHTPIQSWQFSPRASSVTQIRVPTMTLRLWVSETCMQVWGFWTLGVLNFLEPLFLYQRKVLAAQLCPTVQPHGL